MDASPRDTDGTKREILANNLYGEKMGCKGAESHPFANLKFPWQ